MHSAVVSSRHAESLMLTQHDNGTCRSFCPEQLLRLLVLSLKNEIKISSVLNGLLET